MRNALPVLAALLVSLCIVPQASAFVQINSPSEANSPYSPLTWDAQLRGTATHTSATGVWLYIKSEWGGETRHWQGTIWGPSPARLDANFDPLTSTFDYNFIIPGFSALVTVTAEEHDANVLGSDEVTVLFDRDPPNASFYPIPNWTRTDYVPLEFRGSDYQSGLESLEIFYMILDKRGAVHVEWTPLPFKFTQSGSYAFGNSITSILDNYTYLFKINGLDLAGNSFLNGTPNTTIDTMPPNCVFDPLPPDSYSTFDISWEVTENISGVKELSVEFSQNGNKWEDTESWCPYSKDVSEATCSYMSAGTYDFRCSAIDNAGSQGGHSSAVTTTVHSDGPTISFDPLPEFTNALEFPLSWSASSPSLIKCYYINYEEHSQSPGTWKPIKNENNSCLPRTLTSLQFGSGSYNDPSNLTDNQTYVFNLSAEDKLGYPIEQIGQNTTIDTTPPTLVLKAYDQNWNPIIASQGEVRELTVNTTATDAISGIVEHFIFIEVTKEKVLVYTQTCPESNNCDLTVDVEDADQVLYYAQAIDSAGNVMDSHSHFLSPHPLANFVTHDARISMGSSFIAEVQVRNTESQKANVTLILEDYALAGFIGGSGDFASYDIHTGGRTLKVEGLSPMGTATFSVEVVPTDPSDYTPQLNLTASSTLSINDGDVMYIQIAHPTSFSGLTEHFLLLLGLLSVIAYSLRKR